MSLRRDLSQRAKVDIAKRYKWYVKEAGSDIAERFYDAFLAGVSALELQPGLGLAEDFGEGRLRGLHFFVIDRPFNAHLIFYRYDSEVLWIVRVMHGARDLPRRLMQEDAASYGESEESVGAVVNSAV
jgi:toxin ParE1/3/4